jgi:hypothetical protein
MTFGTALLVALLAGLPYPQPRVTPVSDRLKCDYGKVLRVDPAKGEMIGQTPAGEVHYKVGPDVQVFDKAGKPIGSVGSLVAGQKYRAYYVVAEGAIVSEITAE